MRKTIRGIFFAGALALGVAGMLSRWDDVFVTKDLVAFLDPDCYSRMTRIAYGSPWSEVSRVHLFENAPQSVVPHTTAAMDVPLFVLAKIIGIDYAGAWISPLLGFLFLGVFAAWAWRRSYGWVALMLVATSPILAHGFSIGRPDHQSLIILLCAIGLMAEVGIWERFKRHRGHREHRGDTEDSKFPVIENLCASSVLSASSVSKYFNVNPVWVSAVVWPLALWTSLFEPLILLTCCLVARVVVLGRDAFPRERRDWTVIAVTLVLLVPALADGLWRSIAHPLPPETVEYFSAWSKTIGELRPASWSLIFSWIGWLTPIFPALLLWRGAQKREKISIALAVLFCIVLALTLWTARWGYFLPVIAAVCAPFALGGIGRMENLSRKQLLHALFVVSLWPVAGAWDAKFDKEQNKEQIDRRLEEREEAVLLHEIVQSIPKSSDSAKIILAPWWLSPVIAYWGACREADSSIYCVAGSSHQSLPGIVDTAKFSLATDNAEALKILQERKVDYVLVDTDYKRSVQTSLPLLGRKNATTACMAYRLAEGKNVPPFLKLAHRNQFFKLYRVVD